MVPATSLDAEIAHLRAENQRLSEQVKRLVRAERRMIESQDRLDGQISLYRQLNEIGKRVSQSFSISGILQETLQFIVYDRNFQRCLILQRQHEQFQLVQHEGYYEDDNIVDSLALDLHHPAFQAFVSNQLIGLIDSPNPALRDLGDRIGMDEFIGFMIAESEFLILLGNARERAKYHHRIQSDDDAILGLINLMQTIQSAISQANLYTQIRDRAEALEQTLQELQHTQSQLIQSEKMSSLGQLVAGVAHEINNPVSFIYGNISHASAYAADLIELVKLYRKATDAELIQEKEEEIDLEFLMEDLPKLLTSMTIGADRIREIVASLKIFSRMDEPDCKAVDLQAGIDSTLMILKHRLKATPDRKAITIVTNYADLPLIECFAGQLNQVFMNLLSNAIDALEELCEQDSSFSPRIEITTEMIETTVRICIHDNGSGIPESIQSKLFDPFFTTKPVGKGTGLGLSISHQIVTERHHGSLECISNPIHGTEFIITIPVKPA
ncbi:ATP-binding protein [Leptolyngbya boryana CZ1]|uniref:histidine kinase n=1 Tax=Leptolyngbya boryana CZ1 TaxID=3060204 RepID=A0AA96WUP4_LEPBY|nr:ATP-binding protein [Leptolyngbya boryana]WNZ45528.1 ATP-binding protein [Leptolyngbya boryana CZ1]